MKITSFNPLILTNDIENTVKLFEDLGFERHHTKDELEDREDISGIRMKDASGFHVDIMETKNVRQDAVMIRMNVDDLEAAKELLESYGFKALSGEIVQNASSRSIGMGSPSGFAIALVQHIR